MLMADTLINLLSVQKTALILNFSESALLRKRQGKNPSGILR